MSSARKRHYPSDEEEGRISTEGEEEGEIKRSGSKRSKKSKKHKKDKRHHKSKRRRRRSDSLEENDRATDKEGGSTPEIEAGEVVEISDEDRSNVRARKRRSRSNSRSRKSRRSRSTSSSRQSPAYKKEESMSPPPIKNEPLKLGRSPSPAAEAEKGGAASDSLSIEETNKLRASIGLPPLKVNSVKKEDKAKPEEEEDGKEGRAIPNSEVRHKPAENLTAKSETSKIRERLEQRRMKRKQEAKLLTVTTLGASDEVDDTAKWLQRQKRKAKEKKEAEKRAKMLEELDEDFGVNNIVQNDKAKEKSDLYRSNNLSGLTVEHDSSQFQGGKSVILTLKDAEILDNDATDTLVNVNMVDDEKVAKNKEIIKKAKAGYNPYDQEEIDEETGELRRKNMLDKYDEELDGETKKKSFVIGHQGTFNEEEEREFNRAKIREKLSKKNVETLQMPQLKQASDYYTEEEVVKFKKPKKKKKVKRKMLKADDLLGLEPSVEEAPKSSARSDGSKGVLPMDIDEVDVKPEIDHHDEEMSRIKVDDDDLDLQLALRKARRIRQRQVVKDEDHTAKLIEAIKEEPIDESTGAEFINTFENDQKISSNIILNQTSEFCRSLGATRSYEGTGLGESVHQDIRDFEDSLTSIRGSHHRKGKKHKNRDSDDEDMDTLDFYKGQPVSSDDGEDDKDNVILDAEPNLQSGIANAIRLATNKGYWEMEDRANKSSKLKHLEAKNYTIEDKGDDRHSRRGGGGDRYGGSSQPFQEKKEYKPNVKLEYIDDDGRMLNQKEAFRHLSHKFHGKGSGKLKTEKRVKKHQEDSLMRNMSSTDTPLNTAEKLRQRQKEAATPYVILSGNKVQATDLRK